MEIVYALCFIVVALGCAPLFRKGGGRPRTAATIAVAGLGYLGYNSGWARGQSPWAVPMGVAVIAGLSTWAGLRLDLAGRAVSLWRLLGRGASRTGALSASGGETRRGLPVTSPDFGGVSLREVMTPKTMIAGVDVEASTVEAVRVAGSSGHSRLVVYEDDLDHIVGVVSIHSLLEASGGPGGVRRLVRPALFVPECKKCFGMLEDFLREREQFSVALDEFGGTAGVVTVEDLLDELVGEMADEHDRGQPPIRRMPDGSFLVPGHTKVDELNERLGIEVPEGDYETVSGFVLEKLGRVPARGDRLSVGAATLEIAVSTARRIVTIKVTVNGGEAASPLGGE